MLHNWYFPRPVNQREISGTFSTAGSYFIDRWKLISGTVTLTANGLVLNGTMVQILEHAVGTNVAASVKLYSGTATASYNNSTKTFTVTSNGGIIQSVKLEQGNISTLDNDVSPDYGTEMAKCQRYFIRYKFYSAYIGIAATGATGTTLTGARVNVVLPCEMRIIPTIIFNNAYLGAYFDGKEAENQIIGAQWVAMMSNNIRFAPTLANAFVNNSVITTVRNLADTTAYVDFDANL